MGIGISFNIFVVLLKTFSLKFSKKFFQNTKSSSSKNFPKKFSNNIKTCFQKKFQNNLRPISQKNSKCFKVLFQKILINFPRYTKARYKKIFQKFYHNILRPAFKVKKSDLYIQIFVIQMLWWLKKFSKNFSSIIKLVVMISCCCGYLLL